ncbi:MAG: MarR family transcriptional regulator, partial [Pseudophaeobacter sp.]
SRSRDEKDRRSEHLRLTPAGEAAYRDLRAEAQSYDGMLAKRFTPEEVALLRRMLRQLAGIEYPLPKDMPQSQGQGG